VIFLETLIQKTNRFERAPLSREVAELISVYTIIPKEDDLKKSEGTLKFIKASNWMSESTSHPISKENLSKTPKNDTSSWNTLDISENISGLNFLSLNEKEATLEHPNNRQIN